MAPQVADCKADWDGDAGPAPASLMLRLSLAPGGLEAAALEAVEAPARFRTCLGAVVWQVRWPAPASPTTLRFPLADREEEAAVRVMGAAEGAAAEAPVLAPRAGEEP